MMTRDGLKKMAKKNPELWTAYAKQRNNVTKEISKAIEDNYNVLVEKNKGDPKKCGRQSIGFWKRMLNLQPVLVLNAMAKPKQAGVICLNLYIITLFQLGRS